MELEEIYKKASKLEGIEGMTVNERLYVSGLLKEFDDSKRRNIDHARTILKALKVDEPSINKILNLPKCQPKKKNIIVEYFTEKLQKKKK